jgi:pre-mRNA-splicing factor ATP-dependent RNA helicase DHX16
MLTEREKLERRYKKKILELAKKHDKAGEIEKVQRYHMPQDRKDGKEVRILSFFASDHKF